jgi:hypothetical protein
MLQQTRKAEAAFLHSLSHHKLPHVAYDIAVVRLDSTIQFNHRLHPVCLASPDDPMPETCELVGGWNGGRLQRVSGMKWYNGSRCQSEESRRKFARFGAKFRNSSSTTHEQGQDVACTLLNGKLCHVTGLKRKSSSPCANFLGGPLLCSGTSKSQGRHADDEDTLKQFGVSETSFTINENCSTCGSWLFAASVQTHLLWLEFVALPMLANSSAEKAEALALFQQCMVQMHWTNHPKDGTSAVLGKRRLPRLTAGMQRALCRWFVAYNKCWKTNPTPTDCYFLDKEITPDLYNDFESLRCRLKLS